RAQNRCPSSARRPPRLPSHSALSCPGRRPGAQGHHGKIDGQSKRSVVSLLGVQSRSEVGWIVSESPRLVCPSFADVLVGSEPLQGLDALSEVVGVEEGFEVLSELLVGLVVIAPNGGFLEGAVHPLDLNVGPGMVRVW